MNQRSDEISCDEIERRLDEELEGSFPASDPLSLVQPGTLESHVGPERAPASEPAPTLSERIHEAIRWLRARIAAAAESRGGGFPSA